MDYAGHNALGTSKGIQMHGTDSSMYHRAYGSTKMAIVEKSHGRDNMDVASQIHRAYGSTKMARVEKSHGRDNMDVASQIHRIETEAYSAVLRAFIAQSNVLSWGKEGLITELRKELNVTDIEHRELLMQIDSNESVRMIREWRKGITHAEEPSSSKMKTAVFSCSERYAVQKKLKTSHQSVPVCQKYISYGQPSSPANPSEDPISLDYVMAKVKDGEKHRELVTFSTGNAGLSMNAISPKIQAPYSVKVRAPEASHTKMTFHDPDGGNIKRRHDLIEIRETKKLIQEVERMIFGRENPDRSQVERAKSMLCEHEGAILEALTKLADISDADGHPHQSPHHFSHDEQQLGLQNNLYTEHMDQLNGYFDVENYVQTHSNRLGWAYQPFSG